jgi:molybdate transport system substrate-binding protein
MSRIHRLLSILVPASLVAAPALLAAAAALGQATQPRDRVLTVFAAASLTEPFDEIAALYRTRYPGVTVRVNYAGSQQLAAQLEHGASADVFASADQRWMDHVRRAGLMTDAPVVFARNRLVVVLPASNPGGIERLEDLARPGLKLVLAADAVPAGRYSREVLRKLARLPGFPPDYDRRVLANVASEEENVKSVAAKVQLGEADAGFVYRSDVTREVSRYLTVLEIPKDANVLASYPIVVVAGGDTAAARSFVDLVTGAEGKRVLAKHGLIPAGSTP